MIRFLLASTGALLLGSMAAFFFFVSLVSIATIVWILVGFMLMFGLGTQIAARDVLHDERKTRPRMTKIELKQFSNTLTRRQSELEGLIRNREAAAIETSADALDQIQHMVERELALETLGRESAFLRETRAALGRIDKGVFGICLDCEDEINLRRLAAIPWAARCIACQERADREGATADRSAEPLLVEAA
jgi:DnaK suppressor protein